MTHSPSAKHGSFVGLATQSPNLLLTFAWNPRIRYSESAIQERRRRLVGAIRHYTSLDAFSSITLADSTLRDGDIERLTDEFPALRVPKLITAETGAYSGPSYLEALLLREVSSMLVENRAAYVKISGGYVVKNIVDIVKAYERQNLDGLFFLLQSPFEFRPKYAMSSFYVASAQRFRDLLGKIGSSAERARQVPLEAILLDLILTAGASRGVHSPYPIIEAYFSTAGFDSSKVSYRIRMLASAAYSKLGLWNFGIAGART